MTTALPFPSPDVSPVAPHPSGITVTAALLADEANASRSRAERVLAVAIQVVTDYAPGAPVALLDEGVIRFGSYLLGSDVGAVRKETVGPYDVEHVVNHAAAFRNCGAAALLTRHKVRRAGAIG